MHITISTLQCMAARVLGDNSRWIDEPSDRWQGDCVELFVCVFGVGGREDGGRKGCVLGREGQEQSLSKGGVVAHLMMSILIIFGNHTIGE